MSNPDKATDGKNGENYIRAEMEIAVDAFISKALAAIAILIKAFVVLFFCVMFATSWEEYTLRSDSATDPTAENPIQKCYGREDLCPAQK